MSAWWESLIGFEKFFVGLAIPFTVLFIIQMILLVIGIDNGGDVDGLGDVEGDIGEDFGDGDVETDSHIEAPLNFKIFTIRNLITFGAVFSWAGIVGINNNYSKLKTIIFSFSLGFVVVLILSAVYSLISKATQSGTMDIKNAIGEVGEVYLRIPEYGKGEGKVSVIVQGSLRELEAISLTHEIRTGSKVKIIDVDKDGKLVVEPLNLIEEGEI